MERRIISYTRLVPISTGSLTRSRLSRARDEFAESGRICSCIVVLIERTSSGLIPYHLPSKNCVKFIMYIVMCFRVVFGSRRIQIETLIRCPIQCLAATAPGKCLYDVRATGHGFNLKML
jgi:hypothetical protein